MPNPLLISVDPDPPAAGQHLTISYAFPDTGPGTVDLTITWSLVGNGDKEEGVVVTRADSWVEVTVPAAAGAVNIYDESGQSADFGAAVKRDN